MTTLTDAQLKLFRRCLTNLSDALDPPTKAVRPVAELNQHRSTKLSGPTNAEKPQPEAETRSNVASLQKTAVLKPVGNDTQRKEPANSGKAKRPNPPETPPPSTPPVAAATLQPLRQQSRLDSILSQNFFSALPWDSATHESEKHNAHDPAPSPSQESLHIPPVMTQNHAHTQASRPTAENPLLAATEQAIATARQKASMPTSNVSSLAFFQKVPWRGAAA